MAPDHASSEGDATALRPRWGALWHRLAPGGRAPAFDAVAAAYEAAGRHYHNLRHLSECFEELDAVRHLLGDPDAVEVAVWYHDLVYEPLAADNEERSARAAQGALRAAGAGPGLACSVGSLILATRHVDEPSAPDARMLADIDLTILGKPAGRFDEYERAIRLEYRAVPEESFRAGRTAVLRRFLGRPFIYLTDPFRGRYERAARENLRRSLARLEQFGS